MNPPPEGNQKHQEVKTFFDDDRFPAGTVYRLLKDFECVDSAVSVADFSERTAQLRQLADYLDDIAEKYLQEQELLRRRKASAASEFERMKTAHWVTGVTSHETLINVVKDRTLGEALETYRSANAALAEINSCCDRLDVLTERLRRKAEVLVDFRSETLESGAELLQQRVSTIEDELARLSRQEADVAELLELVSELSSVDSARGLAEANSDLRAALFHFVATGDPVTEQGQRFSQICRKPILAGLLFRFAWPTDHRGLSKFLDNIPTDIVTGTFESAAKLIAFLDVVQIYDLLRTKPESFSTLGFLLLADSIILDRPNNLLFPLPEQCKQISHHCTALFEEFQHAAHRQQFQHAVAGLRQYLSGTNGDHESNTEQLKADLINYMAYTGGLTKHYYALRITAQQQFVKPIRKLIEADAYEEAIVAWNHAGPLDEKVEETIRLSDIHRGIVASHRDQTRKYLETFEAKLSAWVESVRDTHNWSGQELVNVLDRMSSATSEIAANWWSKLTTLQNESSGDGPRGGIGETCSLHNGELVLLDAEAIVTPYLPLSWCAACSSSPLTFPGYISDQLRVELGRAATSDREVVEGFVDAGEFLAALDAAEEFNSKDLIAFVNGAAAERRRVIHDRYRTIFDEAKEARRHDEYVEIQLTEIEGAFQDMRFDVADLKASQLDDLLADFRNRKTPEYELGVRFLSEAGETVQYEETTEQLECRIAAIKHKNTDRREHLGVLLRICDAGNLPVNVSAQFRELAALHDSPRYWPDDYGALSLATAIDDVSKYLVSRLKYGVDAITESLPHWVQQHLEACLGSPAEERNDVIAAFVRDARIFAEKACPEQRIKDVLGLGSSVLRVPARVAEQPQTAESKLRTREVYRAPEANVVVSELRSWLLESIRNEPRVGEGNLSALRAAMRNCDWPRARQCAASVSVLEANTTSRGFLNLGEAAYGMCRSLAADRATEKDFTSTLSKACLAVACCERSDIRQALSNEYVNHFIALSFIRIVRVSDPSLFDKKLAEETAQAISQLAETDEAAAETQRIASLLANANRIVIDDLDGCAFFSEALWEIFKGLKDNGKPRSDLLILLFKLRRYESIHHLVQHAAAGTQDEIRSCLQIIQRLSAEPSLYQAAAQRFLALRERSAGKTNTRPWIRFFELQLSVTRQPEEPLTVVLESEFVVPDCEGKMLIELELRPSVIDPPQELYLEVSDPVVRTNLLESEHDFLTGPRVITVTVPSAAIQDAGSTASIAYRISGKTLLDRRIDVRGVWELPVSRQRFAPIDHSRLSRSWPGFAGQPVHGKEGFHGRTQEIETIERYLTDSVRPRSAMLFGQRRIGKTSLLLELIKNFPPQIGHVCAVFIDLSGLNIGNQPGGMQTALFQKIVTEIETKPCNELVHQAINGTSGKRLSRLITGIEPEVSLSGAFEELVRQIDTGTNGRIKRMAFFIDEFDRFVEPLLTGRDEEVEKLLWALRPVTQQSTRVSLILAGSGLQRVFTNNYDKAFFGSIDEIEIKAFKLTTDRVAIEDTFLPIAVRNDLTSDTHRKRVIERAFNLTGGHPYFLAMLGYAAAQIANGHMLTPALLNRVVERMIQGDVTGITSSKFYYHIFESLKYLPVDQQLAAKIILCRISQQTTAELPWMQRLEAIGDPVLISFKKSTLLELVRILSNEGAMESDDSLARVRIRVPITASAMRRDAERLKQDATLQLEELRIDH